jgi:hypothetical protein
VSPGLGDRVITTEGPATLHGRYLFIPPLQFMALPVLPDLENQLENHRYVRHTGPTVLSKLGVAKGRGCGIKQEDYSLRFGRGHLR